jgi:hypothetical protein
MAVRVGPVLQRAQRGQGSHTIHVGDHQCSCGLGTEVELGLDGH